MIQQLIGVNITVAPNSDHVERFIRLSLCYYGVSNGLRVPVDLTSTVQSIKFNSVRIKVQWKFALYSNNRWLSQFIFL